MEKTNDQLKKKIQQEEEKEKAQIQALNEVEQQIDQGNFFGTIFSGLKAIGLALFNLEIEEGDYLPVIVFDQELGRVKNKAEQPHSQWGHYWSWSWVVFCRVVLGEKIAVTMNKMSSSAHLRKKPLSLAS